MSLLKNKRASLEDFFYDWISPYLKLVLVSSVSIGLKFWSVTLKVCYSLCCASTSCFVKELNSQKVFYPAVFERSKSSSHFH